jgi:hypothetical protein
MPVGGIMNSVTALVPDSLIKNGCTKPYYITCDDGEQYVVKFKENPESSRVLANEFVCAEIADLLELPLSAPKLINVDESFVQDFSGEISLHIGDTITSGLHFGTKKIKKTFQITTPHMLENANNINCIPEIIIFDQLIGNKDRDSNGGNLLYDASLNKIVLIDHTHTFDLGPLWNAHELRRRISLPFELYPFTGFVYRKLVPYVRGNNPFSSILGKLERLTEDNLWHIIDRIPEEWNVNNDEKAALHEYLLDRHNRIEEVLPIIKPHLPFWKGGI